MTLNKDLRVRVAETCGWMEDWRHDNKNYEDSFMQNIMFEKMPQYETDLNAIHKVIMELTEIGLQYYIKHLDKVTLERCSASVVKENKDARLSTASAEECCQAYVKAMEEL